MRLVGPMAFAAGRVKPLLRERTEKWIEIGTVGVTAREKRSPIATGERAVTGIATNRNHFFRLYAMVNAGSFASPMYMLKLIVLSSGITLTALYFAGLPSMPGPSPAIVSVFVGLS